MARPRQNGLFSFLTEKRETYRRDVKGERADLVRKAKAEKAAEAKAKRDRDRKAADYDRTVKRERRERVAAERSDDRERKRKEDMQLRREELKEKKLARKTALDSFMGARLYKLGTGEYATSIDSSRFDSLRDAKDFVKSVRENPGRRRGNPVDAAANLSEAWSGKPAQYLNEYHDKLHYHGVLTDLARLVALEILVGKKHVQKIAFDKKTRLASNERGQQLYIVGGDQSIDLAAFAITGNAALKDLVTVGPIHAVTYYTAKQHLGEEDKTPGPYHHPFGEDRIEKGDAKKWLDKGYEVFHRPGPDGGWFRKGGQLPDLLYDTMNKLLLISGGEYHIDRDDGVYSLGIKD